MKIHVEAEAQGCIQSAGPGDSEGGIGSYDTKHDTNETKWKDVPTEVIEEW